MRLLKASSIDLRLGELGHARTPPLKEPLLQVYSSSHGGPVSVRFEPRGLLDPFLIASLMLGNASLMLGNASLMLGNDERMPSFMSLPQRLDKEPPPADD